MDKLIPDQAARQQVQERRRAAPGSSQSGSGEGADSALASLRELERTRAQCEPAEDVNGSAAGDAARGADSPAPHGAPSARALLARPRGA